MHTTGGSGLRAETPPHKHKQSMDRSAQDVVRSTRCVHGHYHSYFHHSLPHREPQSLIAGRPSCTFGLCLASPSLSYVTNYRIPACSCSHPPSALRFLVDYPSTRRCTCGGEADVLRYKAVIAQGRLARIRYFEELSTRMRA